MSTNGRSEPDSRGGDAGSAPGLPLAGVRVLSLEQFGAGPFGTLHLADLGAEVIKIEDPAAGGDVARYVPPYMGDRDSLYFQSMNRNKRSLTLNLRAAEGRQIFHDLVRVSDAVFSNLRGDQPVKLGLTYADLAPLNPRIVCCALSGFGMTGPRAAEPGYDQLCQAYAGFMSVTGDPSTLPAKSGVSIIDFAGGLTAMLGLVSLLLRARATGIGGDVDVSLLDTAIAQLNYLAIWSLNRGFEPPRVPDSGHSTLVPSQAFPTADGHIMVACMKEKFWELLAPAIGRADLLDDPRFARFSDRLAHKDVLIADLKTTFAAHPTAHWLGCLRGQVPVAPVNTIAGALADEQVRARDMVVTLDHPDFGPLQTTGNPIKLDRGALREPLAPGPRMGADTEAILRDVLGVDEARVKELRGSGVT